MIAIMLASTLPLLLNVAVFTISCSCHVTSGNSASNISISVPLNFSDLFPFGVAEGDQLGPRGDDTSSDPVTLDIPFTFVGEEYTEIIVNKCCCIIPLCIILLLQHFLDGCFQHRYS